MCLNTICLNTDIGRAPRPAARARLITFVVATAVMLGVGPGRAAEVVRETPAEVEANDNTRSAGAVDGSTVTVRLRAARGTWHPEGPRGPSLTVEAFGEAGAALTVPGPLIRVPEGATVAVSLQNALDVPLRVHGLCTRDGRPCPPLDVPARESRDVQFASGRPGTYHYWATTMGAPMPFRELAGALVVDPRDVTAPPDRILVITEWTSLTPPQLREILGADDVGERFLAVNPRVTFVINGLSWPATERLTYRRGETVRWRVINLSSQTHPMHLHGFYFTVLRAGDGARDSPVGGGNGQRVVTQLLPSGGTLLVEWTPEREGNWLFHCHVMHHVSPDRRLEANAGTGGEHGSHGAHHGAGLGMAGMVLGVTVLPAADGRAVSESPALRPRRLTMTLSRGYDEDSGAISVAFEEHGAGPEQDARRPRSPGPVLVLRRGEPVEISVVNRLAEATSIHWHGLELESYYDGVHGWSGGNGRSAPMIEPGGSFVVRLAPPRAGTFIYHTHLHDYRQLTSGLYGALIVTEPDAAYDPATDHVIVLGRKNASEAAGVLQDAASLVVNGERTPRWLWSAGTRHRVRVINITPDDVLTVALRRGQDGVMWRAVAKDGAPVPAGDGPGAPATVKIAVGETYDFEYEAPPGRATLWVDVRTTGGKWQAQGQVIVR
jgi:FtsP/CotA-like multicopper oxidase with cupredoxin domain